MNRWTVLFVALLVLGIAAISCSSGGDSPVTPTTTPGITAQTENAIQSQTHLWGYYDCYIDIETQTVEAVENRSAMFAANVVQFVNGNPANLAFSINATPVTSEYIDVDIDVTIGHPFPGMSQYDGYDVRGVFCGSGSESLEYDSSLDYPELGTDQSMLDDPEYEDGGGPDGYTRWFNPAEFATPGLFGYTPGLFASNGFNGNANVMPYKYFANGLGSDEDVWDFLMGTDEDGVFTAGAKNTRNYYLRFPNTKGVVYGYAIVANWVDETTHPANAPEPVACNVVITDDIYYVDDTEYGGDLILDISLWGWLMQPDAIYLESNMLTDVYMLDAADMIPTAGNDVYSTYHVEVPTDNVPGIEGNEYWVIAELADYDYSNDMGVPNSAASDNLASFFRYGVYTADEPYNEPPIIDSGIDGLAYPVEFTTETYTVTVTEPDGDPLTYVWTLYDESDVAVPGYDGVAGDPAGSLDIDWDALVGLQQGSTPFRLECTVSDGIYPPVAATPLDIHTWVEVDLYVSNHADFDSVPDNGTMTEPYSTIPQALAAVQTGETIVVDYGTGTYNGQVYSQYGVAFTLRAFSWYTTPWGRPLIHYSGGAQPIYIRYTSNVTIQGFTISPYPGSTSNQLVYAYYAHNISILDCHITGTLDYYYYYVMYLYYCDSMTVKNCKFSDLNINTTNTYGYVYFYFYRGNGTHNVTQNEFTEFQESPQTNGYMYMYMYAYYWPSNSNWNNNLMHHIAPDPGTYFSMYLNRIYYPYATVNVGNNTIDNLSADNAQNTTSCRIYGMYPYSSSTSTYGYDCHSNIVSNLNGTNTSPYYYGIYAYSQQPDYNCTYNIQDSAYPNYPSGPNGISGNPMFVNNTTEPYDYSLDTGSPCIGTGKNSNDMGCYGNLPTGETVIGLLLPE